MSGREPTKTAYETELNESGNLWGRHKEKATMKAAGLSLKTQLVHQCPSGKGTNHPVWVHTGLWPLNEGVVCVGQGVCVR